ncbi:MAG: radical SAM protein [Candidatus Woesearchaeota archaeon]
MLTKTVNLFGKNYNLKNYNCLTKKSKKHPKLNLYIKINQVCFSYCRFCNHENNFESEIDLEYLSRVIQKLYDENLLNRIGITGGEPLYDIDLLNEVLSLVFKITKGNNLVTINTNGEFLEDVHKIIFLKDIYGVHVSRHHYLDEFNNEIHQNNVVGKKVLGEINKTLPPKLLRLNCNLIEGYVDNLKKVHNYLEHASQIGVERVGFIGLMRVNGYCQGVKVNMNDVIKDIKEDEKIIIINSSKEKDICQCFNWAYISSTGKIIDSYFRQLHKLECAYVRQFIFDENGFAVR